MDSEELKITAETTAIRGRGWARLAVRVVGLVVVIAGAINLMFGAMSSPLPVELYRGVWMSMVGGSAWPLGDFLAIGVGAAVAHFV